MAIPWGQVGPEEKPARVTRRDLGCAGGSGPAALEGTVH